MSLLNKTGESEYQFPKFSVEPNSYEAKIIDVGDPKEITNTYEGKESTKWSSIISFELPMKFKDCLKKDIDIKKIPEDRITENVQLSYFFSLGKIKPGTTKSTATKAYNDMVRIGAVTMKGEAIADECDLVKILVPCNGNEETEKNVIVDYLRKKLVGKIARIATDIDKNGNAKIDKVLVWALEKVEKAN